MERVIVTGVNGFVGYHLANELVGQGFEVVGVGREEAGGKRVHSNLTEYFQCDMTDYDAVKKLPLAQARAIINLAGLAAVGPSFDNPDLYMRVNEAVLGTICKTTVEQGLEERLRIVAVSSGAVYDAQQAMPLTEASTLDPHSSPYAKSKIAMEELAYGYRGQGVDCVVARPFNHIGPGQAPGFLLPDLYQKIKALDDGQSLRVGNLTTKRDYTDVRDIARAYTSLATQDKLEFETYNVSSGRSLSGQDILAMLLEVMGTNIDTKVDQDLFRPSDAPDLYGDASRLKNQTGWSPSIDIRQTIADFVKAQQS